VNSFTNILRSIFDYTFGGLDLSMHPLFFLDILIVSIFFYYIYIWSRKTKVIPITTGLVILGFAYLVARLLGLLAVEWLFEKLMTIMVVFIPIVFSDEIKKLLEKIGKTPFFGQDHIHNKDNDWITEVLNAVFNMKDRKIGSLIVIENTSILTEYIENGRKFGTNINHDIILSIFTPESPLHDGAAIIRNGMIEAVRCVLPVSKEPIVEVIGTRHRAALGMSEKTDALTIITSEEKGEVSYAMNSDLHRNVDKETLRKALFETFVKENIQQKKSDNHLKNIFHA